MKDTENIIVRFPPSPTGLLQMGNVRTALYNYLFAHKNSGKFLLRIEDTDKERSKKEYEDAIYDDLRWLGLEYDNGSERQVWRSSERTEIYKEKIQELIKKGAAYISQETEGENKEVVRFKNPGGKIKFQDLIRGEVEIDVSDLKDFIIARNIEDPLYHLAVSVDDAESGITHIIRGDDHIANTPRQILIIEALGGVRPIYAHVPLVLAEDKTKLSKRKHGEVVSLKYYRDKGYEPAAIINCLALIGWNPGTEKEIFSLEELIDTFDISKVQKKSGIFNVEKLDWINKEHILRQDHATQLRNLREEIGVSLEDKLKDQDFADKFLKIILDRIHRWGEVGEIMKAGEFNYLFEIPVIDRNIIPWKEQSQEEAKRILLEINEILKNPDYQEKIMKLAEKEGKGNVLWPLRMALSGKEKSPDPFTLINILGRGESLGRVQNAISWLGAE